ncbi:endonuclease III [Petrachloros mirabilis]
MTPRTASSLSEKSRQIRKIAEGLQRSLPSPKIELDYHSSWELLIATILSAQCTDERVNRVTPKLFLHYPTPKNLANACLSEVEQLIRSTGFFKSKAKNIVACSRAITERFNGTVPSTMKELVSLPGVGRKTANVILGNAFKKPAIIVDTHVKRVAIRLGLTRSEDPNRIEADLQELLPSEQWTAVSQRLLLHGRYLCTARTPQCHRCSIYSFCPWKGKNPA